MCHICALALRHPGLDKRDLQRLNPKPLSDLVMLNPPSQKTDKSSASNNLPSPQAD